MLFAGLTQALAGPSAAPSTPHPPSPSAKGATSPAPAPVKMVLREGDHVAGVGQDGQVMIMKIIKITLVEGDRVLHVATFKEIFKSVDEAKAAFAARSLHRDIDHMLIDAEGLSQDDNRVIGNEAATKAELDAYKAFIKEMGQ